MLYTYVPAFLSSSMGSTPTQTAAWGTRVLVAGYAGSLLRVRRSSDNTEQDIGSSGGTLDTTALTTFVGANDGFVVTLYDQAGVAMDVTQATAANQPQLVAAGSILTLGGQPALDFDGTNDYLESAVAVSSLMTTLAGVVLTVFRAEVINTNTGAAYNDDALWADDNSFVGTHLRSSGPDIQAYNWDGNEDKAIVTMATATDYVHVWRHLSSVLYNYLNTSTPVTVSSSTNSSLAGKLRIGRQYSTAYYDGRIAELQTWDVGLADAEITAIGTAAAAVYGITWT